jgi:hypothetical protein
MRPRNYSAARIAGKFTTKRCPGVSDRTCSRGRLFLEKARVLLLKSRQPSAAVEQMLLAAGPGRVRFRIDIQMQRIPRLAPGRPRGEFGAIRHDDFDEMVVRMGVGFHGKRLY